MLVSEHERALRDVRSTNAMRDLKSRNKKELDSFEEKKIKKDRVRKT